MQTGCGANDAVDINNGAATSADEMVMVVVDAVLKKGGGSFWLDALHQAFIDQEIECVVDRLTGNGANILAHRLHNGISRDVRIG